MSKVKQPDIQKMFLSCPNCKDKDEHIKKLNEALEELIQDLRDYDYIGCDPEANICNCSLTFKVKNIESMLKALNKGE